jgi:hypothetical protein
MDFPGYLLSEEFCDTFPPVSEGGRTYRVGNIHSGSGDRHRDAGGHELLDDLLGGTRRVSRDEVVLYLSGRLQGLISVTEWLMNS